MRIAVLDLATRQQPANLDQLVDDGLVRITLTALAGQDVFATKERQIGAERAIVHHVIGDDLLKHAQIAVQLEFLHPVRRRAVDEAGAFGIGHKLSGAEVADVVPFAIAALGPGQRVGQLQFGKYLLGNIANARPLIVVQARAA